MAPKRKNDDVTPKPAVAKTTRETRSSARKTRSMSKGSSSSTSLHHVYERRNKKPKTSAVKVKTEKDQGEKSGVKVKIEKDQGEKSGVKVKTEKDQGEKSGVKAKKEADAGEQSGRTIEIEHCTQCSSFKIRANRVKNAVEEEVSGVKVVLNPTEPRKGCFEIREPGSVPFVSLVDMKRPFTLMKELKMEDVIADIIEKLKK